MKYLTGYILIICMLFSFAQVQAQCTPNPSYADSAFGVWPDTIENFSPAEVGVYYSTVLDFKFPTDGGDVDQQYSGMPIDSGAVNSVTGLPPGMSYTCNNSHCSWLGGQQGCALIDGTCNQLGTYDIIINIDGWTNILNQPILVPMSFTGYRINVWPVGIDEKYSTISEVILYPNPFSDETKVYFKLNRSSKITFSVFDIFGNELQSLVANGLAGDNVIEVDSQNLTSGIYLYKLSAGNSSISKRLIVELPE